MSQVGLSQSRPFNPGFLKLFGGALFASILVLGCGVRGKPQPPDTPAELGRGEPTFKRATEQFAFPDVPSPEPSPTAKPKSPGLDD